MASLREAESQPLSRLLSRKPNLSWLQIEQDNMNTANTAKGKHVSKSKTLRRLEMEVAKKYLMQQALLKHNLQNRAARIIQQRARQRKIIPSPRSSKTVSKSTSKTVSVASAAPISPFKQTRSLPATRKRMSHQSRRVGSAPDKLIRYTPEAQARDKIRAALRAKKLGNDTRDILKEILFDFAKNKKFFTYKEERAVRRQLHDMTIPNLLAKFPRRGLMNELGQVLASMGRSN
jgi:hypothetical protein